MCGIAGWVSTRPITGADAVLGAMNDVLAHRGPDGEGRFVTRFAGGEAALGHRRLAIIDLVTGDQPMRATSRPATIVFNGELYNFRELRLELEALGHAFRTRSDTEVVLEAYCRWGEACVRRFRGMFAFAIWDAADERLFLARDHFGEKPLYFWCDGETLAFASEAKALLAAGFVSPVLDREAVADYLVYRYVPGPRTLFRGIAKLPPGSSAVWHAGRLTERRYFSPPDGWQAPDEPARPVAAFAAALDEAVQTRLISDVPFGAFLSGGIDSSAIVAVMRRHLGTVRTFSVGFAEARYSELEYARLVARHFGTDHHELVTQARDVVDYLPRLIRFRDAPVAEASDVPIYLLAREAATSVKMVLTGEGGDELLAGYPKHRFEPFVGAYQRLVPAWLHGRLVEPLVASLPYGARRLKILARTAGMRGRDERLPRWFGALSPEELRALTNLAANRTGEGEAARPFQTAPQQSLLRQALYFDQTSWLPDNLLERGDRMTMAASLEARMPFLDWPLACLVARLDDRRRIRFGQQKAVLRAAMRTTLPAPVLTRRKVGFRVPFNEWFRGPLRTWLSDHLEGEGALSRPFYRRGSVERLIREHAAGAQNHERLLWTMLSLELFQREYGLMA